MLNKFVGCPIAALLLYLAAVVMLPSCQPDGEEVITAEYRAQVDAWKERRLNGLKSPDGWVSLAGLFWLEEGRNSFGGDSSSALIFPMDRAPAHMGAMILEAGSVYLEPAEGVVIAADSQAVTKRTLIYSPEMGEPVILTHGSLTWFVIKRGELLGVRLRDAQNPALQSVKPLEYYPLDTRWRVRARLEKYNPPRPLELENVQGMTELLEAPGALVFEVDGVEYRLDPLESGERYFIIFADRTAGETTYPAGRYLYADRADSTGHTILDFNLSYSPPCAFTDFATCLLPPPQNELDLVLTAGEKYHDHH